MSLIFNEVMYRQTDGISMGSPLALILVNIFLGFMKDYCFLNPLFTDVTLTTLSFSLAHVTRL